MSATRICCEDCGLPICYCKCQRKAGSSPSAGSVSGLDLMTENRRLRDALRRLEREICTNPTPEKLDRQLEIIAEALE